MVDRLTSRIKLTPHEGRWLRLDRPDRMTVPLVVDSPHSGTDWPREFKPQVKRFAVNRLSDLYVDQIFSNAPRLGGALLAARFPRSFVDVNRSQFDVAPWQVRGPWKRPSRTSDYGKWGHGVIKHRLNRGETLYAQKPSAKQAEHWIDSYWRPYRRTLNDLVEETRAHFGQCIHINAHSMRGTPPPGARDKGKRPDFVLGDRHGESCDPRLTRFVADWLIQQGYAVKINHPFAGVDIVHKSGQPKRGIHALQIEINRDLFMHAKTLNAYPDKLAKLQGQMTALMEAITQFAPSLASMPAPSDAQAPRPKPKQ